MLKLTLFCFILFLFFHNVATAYSCSGRRTDLLVRCKEGVCEQGFLFHYKSTASLCQNFVFKKTGEEKEFQIIDDLSSFDFKDQDGMSLYPENRTGIFTMCDVTSKRLAFSERNQGECFQLKDDQLFVHNIEWASADSFISNKNCRDSANCNSFVKTDYPYDLNLNQVMSAEITKYDQIQFDRKKSDIFYYFLYLFLLPAILIYLRIKNKWVGLQKIVIFIFWFFTIPLNILSLGDPIQLINKISVCWYSFLFLYIFSDRIANFINKLFKTLFKK